MNQVDVGGPAHRDPGAQTIDAGPSLLGRVIHRRAAYELAYAVAAIGAAALALSLAGRRPGWPVGQTYGQDPLIVQIYAAHFRHGDVLPVWSSSDAYGLGTPVLLFYHKAFFIVGGTLDILFGGALKPTLLVTTGVFMIVGAYGMRQAISVVTGERTLQVVGSLGFLLTNWAFSEWLSRGDLAEFSALMVVPWLLYWCLTLVKERRVSWSIIPTMVVLVDAHSAVALVSTVVLVVTGITFLLTFGVAGLRTIYRRLIVATAATTIILAPMLIAELRMSRDYDPASKITEFGATVSHHFVSPWWGYFYLPTYRWLSLSNVNLEVQLDFAIDAVLVAGLLALIIRRTRHATVRHDQASAPAAERPATDRPVVAVLLVSLIAYLFLQFRVSLPLYDVLAPFKVITFPYRMMTFITPLALLLAAVIADWYFRTARRRRNGRLPWFLVALAGAWLALLVLFSPVTAHEPPPVASFFPYTPFLPDAAFTAPRQSTFQTPPGILPESVPMFIEYLPKVAGPDGRELPSDLALYQMLHANRSRDASLSSVPCSVVQRSGKDFEALHAVYAVTCGSPTLVALPISYNAFTHVTERSRAGRTSPVAVHHVRTDPRIVVRVGSGGTHLFVVDLPTLGQILF